MKKLYAPQVDHYVNMLGRLDYFGPDRSVVYDEETYKLLDLLFEKLELIAQRPKSDGVWEFWLQVERGPIEAFGDYKEMLEEGEVSSYQEFTELWSSTYPDNRSWYFIAAVYRPEISYRGVLLGHRQVISQEATPQEGFPMDIHEFVQWLVDSVSDCIVKLKAGTYNKEVEDNLPPQHRTGYVLQKDFWSLFPEAKEELRGSFTPDELTSFFSFAEEQMQNGDTPSERLPNMTAADFFHFCALGYAANDYSDQHLPPRDQYLKHADGRDKGLRDIPLDDASAFEAWLNSERSGGHPWEICRGGNSTHIDLIPWKDGSGYYLVLAGHSWGRTVETIKFFLALRKAGIPVILREAKALSDRMSGEEKVGIVPTGVFPRYCDSYFPGEHIIDFINLPYENRSELAKLCVWQPIPEVHLSDGIGEGG